MSTNAIQIKTDPDFYAPFKTSQGYQVGDLIYLSGQAAIDNDGNVTGIGDFDAHTEKTFANIQRVLEAGGSDLSKITKVTIYLKEYDKFSKNREVAETTFPAPISSRHDRRSLLFRVARNGNRNRGHRLDRR